MNTITTMLIAGAALASAAAEAATLAGVRLEPTLQVGGQTLALASCGVRDTLWIDHYAAGLYLPKGDSPQTVQDGSRPKAVRMKVIQARFLPDNIPEKWRGALKSELRHEPMVRVREAYDRLADGDVVTFAYGPQQGVTMSVNGKTVVNTPGHAVIDSILKAWSGKDPVTGKLNRLTLEHPC
ncbi:MAG TPA: chalcone isomerase family protein [Burkholderiales bacterium]